MSTKADPERDREDLLKTFASKFGDADGEKIIDALVTTAWQISDPAVRVGFRGRDPISSCATRTRGKELGKPRQRPGRRAPEERRSRSNKPRRRIEE